jgi:hypothetical protein
MYSHSDFVEALAAEFPELREQLKPDADLPHLQMGTFAHFTNRAVIQYDGAVVKRAFALARKFFHDADAELKNEFYVSYLEELDLNTPAGEEARKIMPELLVSGWREINEHLRKIDTKKSN